MEIKENKTRISLWVNGQRVLKIELNKLIITNGYSKRNKKIWCIFSFNKIEHCLELLQLYFLGRNITISLKEYKYIQKLYRTMNNEQRIF